MEGVGSADSRVARLHVYINRPTRTLHPPTTSTHEVHYAPAGDCSEAHFFFFSGTASHTLVFTMSSFAKGSYRVRSAQPLPS